MRLHINYLHDGLIHQLLQLSGDTESILQNSRLNTEAILWGKHEADINGDPSRALAARTSNDDWVTFKGHWETATNDPSAWWAQLPEQLRQKLSDDPNAALTKDEIIAVTQAGGSAISAGWNHDTTPYSLPHDLQVFITAYTTHLAALGRGD